MSARVAQRMPAGEPASGRPRARRTANWKMTIATIAKRTIATRVSRVRSSRRRSFSSRARSCRGQPGSPRSGHQLLVARAEGGAVGPAGAAPTGPRARRAGRARRPASSTPRSTSWVTMTTPRPRRGLGEHRRRAAARRRRRARRRARRAAAAGARAAGRAPGPRRWAMPRLKVRTSVERARQQADPVEGVVDPLGGRRRGRRGRRRARGSDALSGRGRRAGRGRGSRSPPAPGRRRRTGVAGRRRAFASSGRSRVASIRSRVLLPAPFGPSTARHSPTASRTSTRSTARRSPKRFTRPARPDELPCPTASPRRG